MLAGFSPTSRKTMRGRMPVRAKKAAACSFISALTSSAIRLPSMILADTELFRGNRCAVKIRKHYALDRQRPACVAVDIDHDGGDLHFVRCRLVLMRCRIHKAADRNIGAQTDAAIVRARHADIGNKGSAVR